MRKALLSLLLVLPTAIGFSQNIQETVTGKPYQETRSDKFKGSPLIFENWIAATAVDNTGTMYPKMMINLNGVEHMPLFITDKGMFYFNTPITEIRPDNGAEKLYLSAAVHKNLPAGYVKILSNKPLAVKLLKKGSREVSEYNVAGTITEFFDASEYYYIAEGAAPLKFKLSAKEAEKVFGNKWPGAQAFAEKNHFSFKNEADWVKVLAAYGSF